MPTCIDYQNAYGDGHGSLWSSFAVVNLTHNHRQNSEKQFADLLNRIRTGQQTEDDIRILETRVRQEDDPELTDCLRIYPTVDETIEFNRKRINDLPGKLYTMEAINFVSSKKNFKPRVDKSGRIGDTQFLNVINLKVGAQVMLIYNIGR